MRNFRQEGRTLHYVNATGADIAAGAAVVVGNMIGVAMGDIANGAAGPLSMEGVYALPKSAGAAIGQGSAAIYDVSAKAFVPAGTATAAGDLSGAVVAWEAATAAATSVVVKLGGVGTVATGG